MSIVAQRYMKALYDLSHGQNVSHEVGQNLQKIKGWLQTNEDVAHLVKSLIIPRKEACAAVQSLGQKGGFHPLTIVFLQLLALQHRLKYLSLIIDLFEKKMDGEAGLVKGVLITAVPVKESQTLILEKHLSIKLKAKVHLFNKVDETILGGFIIQVGSYLVDSCLNTQLTKIQNLLKGNA